MEVDGSGDAPGYVTTPKGSGPNDDGEQDDQLTETLQRTVDEGVMRLSRSLPVLLTTGLVGGADVGIGVFALSIV